MPGAVGAIVAARRNRIGYRPPPVSSVERARQEQAWKEYQHKVRLNRIIKKYDKNGSKKLEKDQLIRLLTDIDSSTPAGTQPSEEEVAFVLKSADKAGDGCISSEELEDALSAWLTFIEKRDEWDQMLSKYDVSNTGNLSKDEVRAYLKDLNGGKDVTDQELAMVMKEADVTENGLISKLELSKATAVWYCYVESEKSGCCTIC
jgi:Ca2+-binding EF-hand superfamily protein